MNKLQKEEEWKKFFDKYNVRYHYPRKKKVKKRGSVYYSQPSFHLIDYGIYFHVGNETKNSDKVSKDQFIYETAVHRHIYKDVLITTGTPDTILCTNNVYSIKKQKYCIPFIEDNELVFLCKETE